MQERRRELGGVEEEERVKGWDREVSTQRHKTRGYRPPGRGRCSAEGVAAVASKRPLGPRRSPSIPDQPGVWWGWEERGWRLARLHHLIWESKVDDAGPRVL